MAHRFHRRLAEAAGALVVLPLVDLFLADDVANRYGAECPFCCCRELDVAKSRGPRPVVDAQLYAFVVFPVLEDAEAMLFVALQEEVPPDLPGLEHRVTEGAQCPHPLLPVASDACFAQGCDRAG
eukprot:11323067-Heterocapsa_arctica.AAC.1